MAKYTVNTHRFDPYRNFKFRILWDGKYVAGLSKIGPLKRSSELSKPHKVGSHKLSGKSPGRTKYEAITLECGVTHDPEFESWANKIWKVETGITVKDSIKDFRKDVIVEKYNEAGQLINSYKIYRCWVSEFQAQPDLDSNANAVAIESIKLENEGWERDYEIQEPSEPSYTEP